MKKGLMFSLMIAFLVWAVSSLAWYPDQEKDGIKDTVSPEEAKKLMEQGTYGMRRDYEPKPGFPWHEDIEKGTLSGEQLMYLEDDAKEEYGFYTRQYQRSSNYLNARGRYTGTGGPGIRYYLYNEGRKIEDGDNYGDVLDYDEGNIKAGDIFRISKLFDVFPPVETGKSTLEYFYLKTPAVYKEADRWVYMPGRRKVIRLGAASKAQLRGAGIATYDDTGGRTPWEHEHTIIGTDILQPEELSAGRDGFWADHTSLKRRPYITKPVECWVVLSKPREPGYYLGQQVSWIPKSKDHRKINRIRLEQYDREMNLWKIWEDVFSDKPHPEDGEYSRLGDNTWDLRRDFRDEVIFQDEHPVIHNWLPWKEQGMEWRQFFSIDLMMKEYLWTKTSTNKLRKKRWDIWKNNSPPNLLRDRFPEYRKIVLRKEIEEKIRKLVEKGIFE